MTANPDVLDLDAIETRANAATDGPWRAHTTYPHTVWQGDDEDPHIISTTLAREVVADAEFIAHARTDVPALVAEVRRLRAESDRLVNERAELLAVVRAAEAWADAHNDRDVRLIRRQSAAPVVGDLYDAVERYQLVRNAAVSRRTAGEPAGPGGDPVRTDETATADRQYLIWSNHHKAWWGPNGNNYFKDVARAGRYAVSDTARWLGRGCGCCKVPEVLIPAAKVSGKSPQSVRGVVTAATRAAVKAGQTNSYYGK